MHHKRIGSALVTIPTGGGLGAVAGTAISLGRSGESGVLAAGSRLSVQTTQDIALR